MAKLINLRSTLTASLAAVVAFGLHTTTASAVPIAVGDAIAVDLSSVGGSATNFNVISSSPASITAGSVTRHSDGATVDGVSLAFTFTPPQGTTGFNDGGTVAAKNWAGTSADPYYVVAAQDLAFETGTGAMSLTFAGLNNSLTYNVRIYSLLSADGGRTQTFSVTNGTGFETVTNSRAVRWSAATLEAGGTVFSGVSVNASNQIVVSYTDGNHGTGFMNAVVLEVVPEPASLALVGLGGVLMLMRQRPRD